MELSYTKESGVEKKMRKNKRRFRDKKGMKRVRERQVVRMRSKKLDSDRGLSLTFPH